MKDHDVRTARTRRATWDQVLNKINHIARQSASADDEAWVRAPENLLTWLNACRYLRTRTESHIARDRTSLAEMRPPQTGPPPRAYLKAKAAHDLRTRNRTLFIQKMDDQIAEAKYLIGYHQLSPSGVMRAIDLVTEVLVALRQDDHGDQVALAFTLLNDQLLPALQAAADDPSATT